MDLHKLTDRISVVNGDCMELMKQYPDKHFDLAIVDPPYGIGVTHMAMGSRKTVTPDKNPWDDETPRQEYFDELRRVSKSQIIWGANNFFDKLGPSQYFAIWDKGETMYGRSFAEAEFAWVSDGGTRIIKLGPNQHDRIHPTQKPVELYHGILNAYAKPGMKILDTHLGSGSIAIACHTLGYELVASEISSKYYNLFIKRFSDAIQVVVDNQQLNEFF